jgi:hypothetical protein
VAAGSLRYCSDSSVIESIFNLAAAKRNPYSLIAEWEAMIRAPWARYMQEVTQEAVQSLESGQSIASMSRTLGLVEQTLLSGSRRIGKGV